MNDRYKKQTDELARKLEEVEAKYDTTYNNNTHHSRNNDGIHFWRGKKIISLDDWSEILGAWTQTRIGDSQNTKEALQYFPDDYSFWLIFPFGVEAQYKEEAFTWWCQYMELMKFRRNPKCEKVDLKAFIERMRKLKENPNLIEDEYREKYPDAKDGPWNAYGFH